MMQKITTIAFLSLLVSVGCASADDVDRYGYRVINVFPHDRNAFTQGLFFRDGFIYESTGLNGSSSIRKVSLTDGKVVQIHKLASQYFGEGIVDWGDRLINVTWKSKRGFVFDLRNFSEQGSFHFGGEGWGLTRNETHIIMSDGTEKLRFLNPDTFKVERTVNVTFEGQRVRYLNELEWIDGELFSNVWQTDWIMRIDSKSGEVTGLVDMSGLFPESERRSPRADVLNGIAYDAETERIFVTGKNWPNLFEIEFVQQASEN